MSTEGDLDGGFLPDGWGCLMAVYGLDATGLYLYMQNQYHQQLAGVAEIYIGSDLTGVRLRPGDLVTTAQSATVLGRDGGDVTVSAMLAGPRPIPQVRVYRRLDPLLAAAVSRHGTSPPIQPRRAASCRSRTPWYLRRHAGVRAAGGAGRAGNANQHTPDGRARSDRSRGVGAFDDIVAQAEEKLRQIDQTRQQFERTEVTGRSRNNAVTAKMRGTGQVVDITIDPKLLQRYDAKSVGGFVTEAVNDALRMLNEANQAIWAPLMAEVDLASTR